MIHKITFSMQIAEISLFPYSILAHRPFKTRNIPSHDQTEKAKGNENSKFALSDDGKEKPTKWLPTICFDEINVNTERRVIVVIDRFVQTI
jgi:hypothetical protein